MRDAPRSVGVVEPPRARARVARARAPRRIGREARHRFHQAIERRAARLRRASRTRARGRARCRCPEKGGRASTTNAARTAVTGDAERIGEAGADARDLPIARDRGATRVRVGGRRSGGRSSSELRRSRRSYGSPLDARPVLRAARAEVHGGEAAAARRRAAAPPATRARGRRLAVASHPAGMTFRTVFTEWVPTLAIVGLGGSPAMVGLQSAFDPLGHFLQLGCPAPSVGRWSKRRILARRPGARGRRGAPAPRLRPAPARGRRRSRSASRSRASPPPRSASPSPTPSGFRCCAPTSSPGAVGRFFGTIRSGLAPDAHRLLPRRARLARAPPGLARPALRGGSRGGRRAPRAGLAHARAERAHRASRSACAMRSRSCGTHPRLRRYLLGVGAQGALWTATLPFVIVMMRRVIGMSDAQVIGATVAAYAGGLVSLYPWGRAVDVARSGAGLPLVRARARGVVRARSSWCASPARSRSPRSRASSSSRTCCAPGSAWPIRTSSSASRPTTRPRA